MDGNTGVVARVVATVEGEMEEVEGEAVEGSYDLGRRIN